VLREALDKAWQHRGRAVVISGAAGIGKSRIVAELAAEAARRAGRILLGRCYETEQILPFGPWVNAIRNGDVLNEIAGAGGLPSAWQAELARLFPELGESPPPADYAHTLRIFEAMAQLVGRLTRPQPLLLVLEDLHWADEMSLRLLAFVARQIQTWSVLVVITAREEELPGSPLLGGLLHELLHGWATMPVEHAAHVHRARSDPPGRRCGVRRERTGTDLRVSRPRRPQRGRPRSVRRGGTGTGLDRERAAAS
jgi:predicted ATPase